MSYSVLFPILSIDNTDEILLESNKTDISVDTTLFSVSPKQSANVNVDNFLKFEADFDSKTFSIFSCLKISASSITNLSSYNEIFETNTFAVSKVCSSLDVFSVIIAKIELSFENSKS
jgi:hypothetical protein